MLVVQKYGGSSVANPDFIANVANRVVKNLRHLRKWAKREDVIAGLSLPQKTLPPKYFYDARGSELFEAICRLREYYPTRCELALMRRHLADIARFARMMLNEGELDGARVFKPETVRQMTSVQTPAAVAARHACCWSRRHHASRSRWRCGSRSSPARRSARRRRTRGRCTSSG